MLLFNCLDIVTHCMSTVTVTDRQHLPENPCLFDRNLTLYFCAVQVSPTVVLK